MNDQPIEVVEFFLPTWLAPYLINGDCSDMNEYDIKKVDEFLEQHNDVRFVSCNDDTRFMPWNDMNSIAGDCCTFIAHRL